MKTFKKYKIYCKSLRRLKGESKVRDSYLIFIKDTSIFSPLKSSYTDEHGFIIVVALMVILLLTAVGAIVFNITTQDIRVSTRVVAEKKAFSAAQAGIHRLIEFSNQNAGVIGNYIVTTPQIVDSTADSYTKYTIGNANIPNIPKSLPMAGFEITQQKNWGQSVTAKSITGINERYNSSVTIDVGIGFGPIEISTQQPGAGG
ncbi:MAG: pilus assembly PilX N-terminal domain-containing protein [Thermodesulfovibrionales bacterium]|nr:pilus assembly PilX N-terminal domain-containing protein [Thermodesulfovibrionales bacterium]